VKPGEPPAQHGPALWGVGIETRTLPPWPSTTAYAIGTNGVAWLVDPGAGDDAALEAMTALLAAAGVRHLKGILLTHTHPDHADGLMAAVARFRVDTVFVHPAGLARLMPGAPARPLEDGRKLVAGDAVIEALATPGHASDHLAFAVDDGAGGALVAGDLVAGRGSIWVGLPDGDMTAYLASLARAAARAPVVVAPAHGPVRTDGVRVFDEARRHRLDRERSVWEALASGPRSLEELRLAVYGDLDPRAFDLAERSLLAHLRKLMHETRVSHVGTDATGPYARRPGT
jgi:endoribonuclease LACTB2